MKYIYCIILVTLSFVNYSQSSVDVPQATFAFVNETECDYEITVYSDDALLVQYTETVKSGYRVTVIVPHKLWYLVEIRTDGKCIPDCSGKPKTKYSDVHRIIGKRGDEMQVFKIKPGWVFHIRNPHCKIL